ncbi:MAG: formylglycine-generating enzyme family protein [Candidatus Firestonebacteria bacterium]
MKNKMFLLVYLICQLITTVYAQSRIENVHFEQDNKGLVHIYYELINPYDDRFEITLKLSEEGGNTFILIPRALQGDVGDDVTGSGKKHIIWDVEKDYPKLKGENFVFLIEAEDKMYEFYYKKGLKSAEKGMWDEAINSYQIALKYKPNDKDAEDGMKSVQMKKQQKISSYISNGKKYTNEGKYSEAVLEFEKAKEMGAAGEVEKLLAGAKKMNTPHEGTGKYADMIYISAGEFEMGSNDYDNEKPVHKVYLDAYYIDKYEVTFEQYDKFREATNREKPSDSGWGRGKMPVINVSWNDAVAYAEWAGKRLPTEAEWEKACRAGSSGKYCFGDSESELGDYAWSWYGSNSGSKTHAVGQKKPNKWGLYDMHGNVWEWCSDWYDDKYYEVVAGLGQANNPKGPNTGTYKVLRGGSWYNYALNCRSALRINFTPGSRDDNVGFRCVLSGAK